MTLKLALIISGHERNALQNTMMKKFIEKLSEAFTIDLYLHSWHVNEATKSWRKLDTPREISIDKIQNYFSSFPIKYLEIENDAYIKLEQTVDNTSIILSKMLPKVAWKNMWYGKFKCISHIQEHYDVVLMTRYDYFTYNACVTVKNAKMMLKLVDLIVKNISSQLHFVNHKEYALLRNPEIAGDNMVFGSLDKIREYVYAFHYYLDFIAEDWQRYNYNQLNQEHLAIAEGLNINRNNGILKKCKPILIVGAGITGATIARKLAENGYKQITVIDKRDHVAGNCYDYVDEKTNILVNKYGAHIFHTNDEEVMRFMRQFSQWVEYKHYVRARVGDKLVPVPVNIDTVNTLFNTNITTEEEMKKWLEKNQLKFESIENSEQMALSRVGDKLYDLLIKYYTKKQWDKFPVELDASVLSRIPVRTDFYDGYFTDKYQGLPANGYTRVIEKMLMHPKITVKLNTDFFEIDQSQYSTIFYTGPIDHYFSNCGLPTLEYRSIEFTTELYSDTYQSCPVVNYPSEDIPYTRTVEYKHFPNQKNTTGTIVVHEKTTSNGEPYYPVPNERNKNLYEKYRNLAETIPNVRFVGRLASYKYLNMDQAIRLALDNVNEFIRNK
jgi:UDP-galactopyranose mutase